MKSISMIEFRSIARGIEVADTMNKAANIDILRASTICPGKYIVLMVGDTASVKEAADVGLNTGTPYVVSHTTIPNIDDQVIQAIEGYTDSKIGRAVGVLEYYAIIDAVIGADIAVKAANVNVIEIRLGLGVGGKGIVILSGDVAEVDHAIRTAKKSAEQTGMLMETCTIPNFSPELLAFLK